MSEKIRAQHLERKAILYVRQSSPYQVLHNLESQKLQYAMEARLRQLGWREIEVVDEDLGRSAAGLIMRAGFERMVAEVCLGKVGAVAAREVSRFARNSREWQQLVEVCRVVDTVLVDQEMVYAPRLSNDRLLLGLKGSLNEYELDLLRQRSVEARREKARRGELIVSAPIGYIKSEDQRLEKDPDLRVQQAILLVFRKFAELGSVRQTLMWFMEHGLEVPTHTPSGKTIWKRPVYRSMHRMLTSPVYGGAYTYGKTEHLTGYDGVRARHICRRKPREQWLALIPGAHEGYVSWEEFEHIQRMIQQNNQGEPQPGAAKDGHALLAGLLRCRQCGRKLTVRYSGNRHDVLRYSCIRGLLDNGEPRCIAFGITVDEAIGREVLRVVQPAAIEASMLAHEERARQRDDVVDALQRDHEAARYAADRARRQYDAADPENRLVTAELERRWNLALQHVHEIEVRIEQHGAATDQTPAAMGEDLHQLTTQLEAIWTDPATSARLKKRIVRTLIEEVLVDVDSSQGELILTLHWKGGVHTELRLPRRRRGQCSTQTSGELIEAITVLARIASDDIIAGVLNRNGHPTGRGNRWTRERVAALRSHHRIPCYKPHEQQPWINLTDAAALLDVSPRTLRLAIDRGEIPADHPFADGPWVISRDTLKIKAAQTLKQRVRSGQRRPAILHSEQHECLFTTT